MPNSGVGGVLYFKICLCLLCVTFYAYFHSCRFLLWYDTWSCGSSCSSLNEYVMLCYGVHCTLQYGCKPQRLACRVSVQTGSTTGWQIFCLRPAKEVCMPSCTLRSVSSIIRVIQIMHGNALRTAIHLLLTYLVSATFKYDELEVEDVNRG